MSSSLQKLTSIIAILYPLNRALNPWTIRRINFGHLYQKSTFTILHTYFFVPVVCPSFGFGFNTQFLESLNITDEDYKKGSWIGNYSIDPFDSEIKMIYKNATLDVEKGISNKYIV